MNFIKKYSYNFLILLLLTLLLNGVYEFYFYKISFYIPFLEYKYSSAISTLIWNESGVVEYLQVFFLLFTIINFFKILKYKPIYKTSSIFVYFIYLYFFGLIYFFLEEISYGQHIFNWKSQTFFINWNHQDETNLHNISNLFNELPRSLLLIWCSSSFIIIKKLEKNKKIINLTLFIFPSKKLKKISLLLLITVIPDLILKKLNLYVEYPINNSTEEVVSFYPYPVEYIENYELFNFFTFNYVKLSELQELLLCFYICMHIIYIDKQKFIKNSS
jgi:hypothetical protein